jgi:hypothetical protein
MRTRSIKGTILTSYTKDFSEGDETGEASLVAMTIEVPLVGIFDFDGDRLMCEKVYFDMATLMRQLQA